MILFDKTSPYQRVVVIENDDGEKHLKSDPDGKYSHSIFDSKNNPLMSYAFSMASLIPKRKSGNILLIGLGGGGLVKILDNGKRQIDVVEIDPIIIEAAKLFGVKEKENVTIFNEDGFDFLKGIGNDYYDAILIDAYADDKAPGWVFSNELLTVARPKLVSDGVILINKCVGVVDNSEIVPSEVIKVNTDNEIFVIRKNEISPAIAQTEEKKEDKPKDEAKQEDKPEEKPKEPENTEEKPKTGKEFADWITKKIKKAKSAKELDLEDLRRLTDKEKAVIIKDLTRQDVVYKLLQTMSDNDSLWSSSLDAKNKGISKLVEDYIFKTDPDYLSESPDVAKRLLAVRKEQDLNEVAKFALDDSDPGVRAAATRRLTDENVLAEIAIEDKNAYVSWIAVEKLTNKDKLRKVALESEYDYTKQMALERAKDDDLYSKVFLNKNTSPKLIMVIFDKVPKKSHIEFLKKGYLDEELIRQDDKITDKLISDMEPDDLEFVLTKSRLEQEEFDDLTRFFSECKDQKNLKNVNEAFKSILLKAESDRQIKRMLSSESNKNMQKVLDKFHEKK